MRIRRSRTQRSKRTRTRNRNRKLRKTKKGGFSLFRTKPAPFITSEKCNPNKISSMQSSQELKANYLTCCPKDKFGLKNSASYCKQLDINYQTAIQRENDENEYHEVSPEDMYAHQQTLNEPKKAWYKFWGGRHKREKQTRKIKIK